VVLLGADRRARGIRSSYVLSTPARNDAAVVREIARPVRVVIDGETGVLRAVWR
jgi:hypothetical protein